MAKQISKTEIARRKIYKAATDKACALLEEQPEMARQRWLQVTSEQEIIAQPLPMYAGLEPVVLCKLERPATDLDAHRVAKLLRKAMQSQAHTWYAENVPGRATALQRALEQAKEKIKAQDLWGAYIVPAPLRGELLARMYGQPDVPLCKVPEPWFDAVMEMRGALDSWCRLNRPLR